MPRLFRKSAGRTIWISATRIGLPFSIELKAGLPVAQQVCYAGRKAVVGGQLRAGDKFPAVQVLSHELRINPITAHKMVASLVAEGVLGASKKGQRESRIIAHLQRENPPFGRR